MQTNPRVADPYDALDSGMDIKRNSRYEIIKDEKHAEKDETRHRPHGMSRNRQSNISSVLEEISHLKASMPTVGFWSIMHCEYVYCNNPPRSDIIAVLFCSGLLLHQLLHQFLLLDEECPHNSILDAISAAGSTVCTLYIFLILREAGIFTRTQARNLKH